MSVFSDQFSGGLDYLTETSGEAVVYIAPNCEAKPCTAIVGNEENDLSQVETGQDIERKREFTFRLSEVNPVIDGIAQYGGVDWTIVGERSRSATAVRVICSSVPAHERTRRGFRGGR